VLDLLTIALEAHNDERNHHRRYEVSVGRDLLGDWVVSVRHGRVGRPLRERRFGTARVDEARYVVRDRLHRRLSAPRRIGCRYRMTGFFSAAGFDSGAWAPAGTLAELLA